MADPRTIQLTSCHDALLEQLVDRVLEAAQAKKPAVTREAARRVVEIEVLRLGLIEAQRRASDG